MLDQITSGLMGAMKLLTGQKTISEDNIDDALRCVRACVGMNEWTHLTSASIHND